MKSHFKNCTYTYKSPSDFIAGISPYVYLDVRTAHNRRRCRLLQGLYAFGILPLFKKAILLFTDKSAVSTDFKGFADTYVQIFKDLHEYYQSGFAQRVICPLSATVSRIREVSKRAGKLIPALVFYLFDHKEIQSHFPFFIFIIACIFENFFFAFVIFTNYITY